MNCEVYDGVPQYGYHVGVTPSGDDLEVDLRKTANFNMAAFGSSGTGKTFTLRKLIQNFWRGNITVIVPDTQGDLGADSPYDEIPNTAIQEEFFAYQNGTVCLNCLDISVVGKGSGFYPAIQRALRAIQYFHPSMGVRQKSVLTKVLLDTYARFGIHREDESTWTNQPPTIDDALETIQYMLKEAYTGISSNIYRECGELNAKIKRNRAKIDRMHNAIAIQMNDSSENEDFESEIDSQKAGAEAAEKKLEAEIQELKVKASKIIDLECWGNGEHAGEELNISALLGVEQVLQQMSMSRLFSGSKPFKPAKGVINVLNMQGVFEKDQQALFFLLLGRVFNDAMNECTILNKGIPETILVCDEAKLYQSVCEDSMSPFPRIVTEGRKFGLGALIGAQSPNQISREILGNIATQFILPLTRSEWRSAKNVFGLDPAHLEVIRPKSDGYLSINGKKPTPVHLWSWEPRPWSRDLAAVA